MSPPRDSARLPAVPPPRRPTLVARNRAERMAARARVIARVVRPVSAEQRAFDPLARDRGAAVSVAAAAAAILLSSLVHGGVYGVGAQFAGSRSQRDRSVVEIEMREHKPEPVPPEPPPPPPPPPEEKRVVERKPERREVEPPPEPEPPPDKAKPPPRVVGLSLDSTAQGGGGPSFGVGNTRRGQTAERAADPKKIGRTVDPPPSATPNQAASRIPSAGASYVLPKRKRPAVPAYPEKLRLQGIEAAVTVMVSLDRSGKVMSVKIIKSGGYPEFDESARKTALAEEFEPATRDGTPIPYTLSYTYRFTIEDQ